MTTTAAFIWFWCVTTFPFTIILTFIATLVTCSQVKNNAPPKERFPQISQLGTGQAYYYFAGGFLLLLLQLLVILVGRIQLLFQTQYIINRGLIAFIHAVALISGIFLLIMAFVSVDDNPVLHVVGAFGMFITLSIYCFLHTFLVFKLYLHRSEAPAYSNIVYFVWFLSCSLLIFVFFIVWMMTGKGIPQYVAASTPFLYFLGFVPQFYLRAKEKRRDSTTPGIFRYSSVVEG